METALDISSTLDVTMIGNRAVFTRRLHPASRRKWLFLSVERLESSPENVAATDGHSGTGRIIAQSSVIISGKGYVRMLGVIAVLLDPSGACPPTVLASVRWSSKASGRP